MHIQLESLAKQKIEESPSFDVEGVGIVNFEFEWRDSADKEDAVQWDQSATSAFDFAFLMMLNSKLNSLDEYDLP